MREMQADEVLHIIATDPTTKRDLEQFCRFMKNEMLECKVSKEILEFWIRKGG